MARRCYYEGAGAGAGMWCLADATSPSGGLVVQAVIGPLAVSAGGPLAAGRDPAARG